MSQTTCSSHCYEHMKDAVQAWCRVRELNDQLSVAEKTIFILESALRRINANRHGQFSAAEMGICAWEALMEIAGEGHE